MTSPRSPGSGDTWAAAAGIIMLACTMGGFALMTAGGLEARPESTPAQIVRDLSGGVTWVARLGLFLDLVGSLLLVVFAARVAAAVRPGSDRASLVPSVVMGAALLAVAASFVDKAAFQVMARRAGEDLQPGNAVLLVDLVVASFLLFQAAFAAFVLAAAIGLLQQHVGPAWLGRAGVVIGAVGLAAAAFPAGSAAAQLPFPFLVGWILALSAVLMRRPGRRSTLPQGSAISSATG